MFAKRNWPVFYLVTIRNREPFAVVRTRAGAERLAARARRLGIEGRVVRYNTCGEQASLLDARDVV